MYAYLYLSCFPLVWQINFVKLIVTSPREIYDTAFHCFSTKSTVPSILHCESVTRSLFSTLILPCIFVANNFVLIRTSHIRCLLVFQPMLSIPLLQIYTSRSLYPFLWCRYCRHSAVEAPSIQCYGFTGTHSSILNRIQEFNLQYINGN